MNWVACFHASRKAISKLFYSISNNPVTNILSRKTLSDAGSVNSEEHERACFDLNAHRSCECSVEQRSNIGGGTFTALGGLQAVCKSDRNSMVDTHSLPSLSCVLSIRWVMDSGQYQINCRVGSGQCPGSARPACPSIKGTGMTTDVF